MGGVGRHARARLPADAARGRRGAASASRARAAAASRRSIGALDTRIGVVAPSCYITALPMRVANRIFEDPDSDPEQDPSGLISAAIDHAGLLLLVYPRPVFVAAAVLDFFPIEGTRQTFREIAAIYRRFGHGDRIAMTEGYHKHQYSAENQAAAFAFLDRFNGMPAHGRPRQRRPCPTEALRCTTTGQVRVDLRRPLAAGRDPRLRARAAPRRSDRRALLRPGLPGDPRVAGRTVRGHGTARRIEWESAGT